MDARYLAERFPDVTNGGSVWTIIDRVTLPVNEPLPRPVKSALRMALTNYGIVLGLCIVAGVVLTFGGDEPQAVAMKILVVPMFWLAVKGLDGIYRWPIVESRWTVRAVEHTVLHALLFVAFMTVIAWRPDRSLADLFLSSGVMAALFIPYRLYELKRSISHLRSEDVLES